MRRKLLAAAKYILSLKALLLDGVEQGGGSVAVSVVDRARQTGEVLAWVLHGDQRHSYVILLTPAVKQSKELVEQAGEDPEMAPP